jgi:Lipopolysaccharide kinase (Kdo/WaaP) family
MPGPVVAGCVMPKSTLHTHPDFGPALARIGLDSAEAFFQSPLVKAWRDVGERDNATLDLPAAAIVPEGLPTRLHVKRYRGEGRGRGRSGAAAEVAAIAELDREGIPTLTLAAWGQTAAGDSFTASVDLTGYLPADKAMAEGQVTFERLLRPTAKLAARLHGAGLHHQDLYLCHFFVRVADLDLRLIDVSRVRRLPTFWFRNRWIVKDLGQFQYSTLEHGVSDAQRGEWLAAYAGASGTDVASWAGAVGRKVSRIARHDRRLRQAQPNRNISLPEVPLR